MAKKVQIYLFIYVSLKDGTQLNFFIYSFIIILLLFLFILFLFFNLKIIESSKTILQKYKIDNYQTFLKKKK